ncbi:carboxypeptidase-like regulatory domain-containing protein [Spongiivirga sp. MCCC 1A20706]|uniref:carboxypeptidase-like regulatory domain-containing protein n=1 Tax=Spongiivirga sp. MCCC 1A20706 TaxID=3160963 RepID=UPI003977E063
MQKLIYLLLFISVSTLSIAQETDRELLRGTVLYRNSVVTGENVINANTQKATITNNSGQFEIFVKQGDTLVFSAVNYKFKSVVVTKDILEKRRLVVEVKEKVTELDEVVVSPESKERFLELEKEKYKKYDYERDQYTRLQNYATNSGTFYNGVNFVNIFKALRGNKKKDKSANEPLKVSEFLREMYEDEFFVVDLGIEQAEIGKFLFYCDDKITSQDLTGKNREFKLIEFLVDQSIEYKKIPKE